MRFALGLIQYSLANQYLAQTLHLYGLLNSAYVSPFTLVGLQNNPAPQPVSYSDCRQIAQKYYDDLSNAESSFRLVKDPKTVLHIDFDRVRYDSDGSGTIDSADKLFDQRQFSDERNQPQSFASSIYFCIDPGARSISRT